MTIDPLARWRPLPDKPDYAGLLSFGGAPIAQEPAHLEGVDVAIVGAPMDDLVSDRPGTRFAPRAIRAASCPPGPHLEAGIDAFAELRIVDYGDAPVLPADPVRPHDAIARLIGEVVDLHHCEKRRGSGEKRMRRPCQGRNVRLSVRRQQPLAADRTQELHAIALPHLTLARSLARFRKET